MDIEGVTEAHQPTTAQQLPSALVTRDDEMAENGTNGGHLTDGNGTEGNNIDSSDREVGKSGDRYAATVRAYALRTQETHLFSGLNFSYLAEFLTSDLCSSGPPSPHIQSHAYVFSTKLRQDKPMNTNEYNDTSGPKEFLRLNAPAEPDSAQLLFLRGYPSPEWLRVLGAQFRIDPEYFRRHLAFLQPKEYFDIPALVSASRNMFQLRMTSIYRRVGAIPSRDVSKCRNDDLEAVQRHHQSLGRLVGESIVRRYSVHDETMFTIEQNISCYIHKTKHSWAALIWLDVGRSLNPTSWHPAPDHNNTNLTILAPECLPITSYYPKACLRFTTDLDWLKVVATPAPPGKANAHLRAQSAELLPAQYGQSLESNLMRLDVMYALSELFNFVAGSENQFLNFMQTHIENALKVVDVEQELSLATLRYSNTLLDDHVMQMAETIGFIKNVDRAEWPRVKEGKDFNLANETRQSILEDFERLHGRGRSLAEKCRANARHIVNGAVLEESRKAKSQAEKLERLTLLAFLFVPLAFLCGLFGMNFRELGQGDVSIWLFFVVAAPVLLGSTAYCFGIV